MCWKLKDISIHREQNLIRGKSRTSRDKKDVNESNKHPLKNRKILFTGEFMNATWKHANNTSGANEGNENIKPEVWTFAPQMSQSLLSLL